MRPAVNQTETLVKLNSRIAQLTRSHQNSEALQLFNQIHSASHHRPDKYTLTSALSACANLQDIVAGDQLHAYVIRAGFRDYTHIGNTLLSLYAKLNDLNSVSRVFNDITAPDAYTWTTLLSAYTKLGQVNHACQLFNEMPQAQGNVSVWNSMITGCVENGHQEVAFVMFRQMHFLGIRHDNYTFASILSACDSSELLDFGRQVHSLVIRTGFLLRLSVLNAQLTMYFNCGMVEDAIMLFEETESTKRNQITCNAMIAGLASRGRDVEALMIFKEMQENHLVPNERTFTSVISSCSSTGMVKLGHQLHALAIKMGFQTCTYVNNAMITMYSICGDLGAASIVFETLECKDPISWNSMITGYAQGNLQTSAIMVYMQMQRAGIQPDEFTVGSLVANSDCLEFIEMMQATMVKNRLIQNNQVCNALISVYSKHAQMKQAFRIFDAMLSRNLISWNTVMCGCLYNGLPNLGLDLFHKLQISELKPDLYSLSIVLSICANRSILRHGKQVHAYIIRAGFGLETPLGNTLISFYAECGDLDWSAKVFSGMMERDIVSWNAMISAYAHHGEGKKAIACFKKMWESGEKLDQTTFTAVLSACSHAGLVDDGRLIFASMMDHHGISPGVDHYSCIIDLLGRAGHLDEAERLINTMPFQADPKIWWAILSSCQIHGNARLGRIAAGFLLEIETENPAVYVLLSNIIAATGHWEEAANIRELMRKNRMIKQPGCSWVE
ncbi:PREDICTED: pentatricopeptide repeat-containing protein At3g49740 [Nelumbo nucifera]|uniref:Pentatricopeptide repeat-containing protein At3g49740 n=2 Tax=Nelumbo nucifera TaxID=4432 RepID=A0A1U8QBV1_NELNU|nr:PREDICTED: pentatricopeptide repeat-containing protein At3g49740 [Nelumbo nucifera]XP_019055595.1 PREDICTED: pentatricopeptide repeat-containing protein At3g49740 [Nelumbo nucifera]DAD32397.1 TPA_asm: hypothetical protein HUJ06_011248 [Nelumbo nucifera]